MKPYTTIRVYTEAANAFKRLAKKKKMTQSATLQELTATYIANFKIDMGSEEYLPGAPSQELQRIDQVIAIIRNIEKNELKPAVALLHLLVQAEQKHNVPPEPEIESNIPRPNYQNPILFQIQDLIQKIERVKPTFGKPYFQIHITDPEYQDLLTHFK